MLKDCSLLLKPAFRFTINIPLFSITKMSHCQNRYPNTSYYRQSVAPNSFRDTYGNWNYPTNRPDNWRHPRSFPRYNFEFQKERDIQISKGLSYILRHGAFKMNLHMDKYGFVYVNEILTCPGYRNVFEKDIIRIVETNEKRRFHLKLDKYKNLMIGANQGHTIKCEKLKLQPITDAEAYPCVVHGTTYNAWDEIKRNGLKTMGRNHIHFASGEHGEKGVVSGMRSNSKVLIYIDLEKALEYGIKFFLSRNKVILSEGDKDGKIEPFLFKSVIDKKTRKSLKTDF